MAEMTITTLNSRQIWQSPDKQRTIWEVMFTSDNPAHVGKQVKALTYSEAISQSGFLGKVEVYSKPDRQGKEQSYLRQAPKAETVSGGDGGYQKRFSNEAPSRAMYTSYAKDIAVALIEGPGLDSARFNEAISLVEAGGERLFDMAALGIAITKEVEGNLNDRGRVEAVMGHTELVKGTPDPFDEAASA